MNFALDGGVIGTDCILQPEAEGSGKFSPIPYAVPFL